MIRFECPHCGKGLRTDDSQAGEAFTCPECRGRVRVPKAGDSRTSGRGPTTANRFAVKPYQPPPYWSSGRILRAIGAALFAVAAVVLVNWRSANAAQDWVLWSIAGASALAAASLVYSVCKLASQTVCSRCHRWKQLRDLGSIERDAASAKEALEAGDLAALGALSPEGETILVSIAHCPHCGREAPIDVHFVSHAEKEIAHVSYPGPAVTAFERLCTAASNG